MAKGMGWILMPIGLLIAFLGIFMASPLITAGMTLIGILVALMNISKPETQKGILLTIAIATMGGLSLNFGGVESLTQFTGYLNNFLSYIGTMLTAAGVTLIVKIFYNLGKN